MISNGLKHNLLQFLKQQTEFSQNTPVKLHIACSKCPSPAEAHAFRCLRNSLIAWLIVVFGKSSQICCSALLAVEWSWTLGEVCEMPEALHPTHGSQVGWGLVNLVAIRPWRWSRYSEKWKLTGWLHFIWHNFVKFRDNWIKFYNLS